MKSTREIFKVTHVNSPLVAGQRASLDLTMGHLSLENVTVMITTVVVTAGGFVSIDGKAIKADTQEEVPFVGTINMTLRETHFGHVVLPEDFR